MLQNKEKKSKKKENTNCEQNECWSNKIRQNAFLNDLNRINLENLKLSSKNSNDIQKKEFKFWKTQPVPKIDETVKVFKKIEEDKKPEEIKKNSYVLPTGYKWDTLDVNNEESLRELYNLLKENYVEDDDNMFRFDYSPKFIQWALKPPNWEKDWHCGLRIEKTNKLVGFISAIPAKIRLKTKEMLMVEINFLCVHKLLRSKRMAPVLIKEITRRVNLHGIFQAVFTAGVLLPKPIAVSSYWHRSLNPKKLIEVSFSQLGRNMTLKRTLKFYQLPPNPITPGFRKFQLEDLEQAYNMVNEYLKKFDLVPVFNLESFKYWFIPRKDVVETYVVERNNKIVGFASFYYLPSSVMNNHIHKYIKAAYSFYNVSSEHVDLKSLLTDILIIAKNQDYDVFNALDLMDNSEFLQDLKFGKGDGVLHYYLYNFKCPQMDSSKIGLVLH